MDEHGCCEKRRRQPCVWREPVGSATAWREPVGRKRCTPLILPERVREKKNFLKPNVLSFLKSRFLPKKLKKKAHPNEIFNLKASFFKKR